MVYVYRRKASDSARELAESLQVNARRLNDLGRAHFGAGPRSGDVVICWGEVIPNPVTGIRVLNNAPLRNKFEDAEILRQAGIPTVSVSRAQPPAGSMADPAVARWLDLMREVPHPLDRQAIQRVSTEIQVALRAPIPTPATWLPRRFNHVGGADLLRPPTAPDYYSKKEGFTEEYRIHCFGGKSIRAGVKVPRDGATPHQWVRSFDGGWRIKYDEFKSKESMRQLAASAVAALQLDFGAVDIGRKADKSLVVLEVNRAPGLEGNTTEVYARAVEGWIRGERA